MCLFNKHKNLINFFMIFLCLFKLILFIWFFFILIVFSWFNYDSNIYIFFKLQLFKSLSFLIHWFNILSLHHFLKINHVQDIISNSINKTSYWWIWFLRLEERDSSLNRFLFNFYYLLENRMSAWVHGSCNTCINEI